MLRIIAVGFLLSLLAVMPENVSAEEAAGNLVGQFLLDGDVPQRKVIVGLRAPVKGAPVCGAVALYDPSLVIDPKTKGIANIVVYLRKVDKIHPDAAKIPEDQLEIVFDQKHCEFLPHVLGVRTGQTVVVTSQDAIPHNTHTHPFQNQEMNFVIQKNEKKPVKYGIGEFTPVPVVCDLHPHMKAYWVVLEHPYFAITDAQGKFTIKNLPAGDYDFIVWHERGYLDKITRTTPKDHVEDIEYIQDSLNVTITAGQTEDVGEVEVPLKLLLK